MTDQTTLLMNSTKRSWEYYIKIVVRFWSEIGLNNSLQIHTEINQFESPTEVDRDSWTILTQPHHRAGGCVVKILARGWKGFRFDTQVHQLSD